MTRLPPGGDRGRASSGRPGAPTKFTPDLRAAILLYLEVGNFRQTAARWAGIHPATLKRWLKQGWEDVRAGLDTDFARFCAAVHEAEARGETALVDAARAAALEDRSPAMLRFLLVRRYPHWGDRLTRKLAELEWRVRAVEGGTTPPPRSGQSTPRWPRCTANLPRPGPVCRRAP